MDNEIKILTDEELEKVFTDDDFELYMREIRRYPNLSVEEQKSLGRRYKNNNDLKARELLIDCNLRLVVSIASRYKSRLKHFKILDVIQEGNFGLIRAVETYDPELGAFTTYAVPWIKQRIERGLANKDDTIRKSVKFGENTKKYFRLIKTYTQKGLPIPTDEDICNLLDISIKTLKNIRYSLKHEPVSLNQTVDDDEKSELEDFISDKNNDYDNVLEQMVNDDLLLVLKEVLSPLRYFVIYHRILSDEQKTLEEVGSCLKLTKERVRQLEASALKKIKPYILENSAVFRRTLDKIKQREGKRFNSLKRTPLSPTQIIRYMYLKDDLTELERKFYELNLFGKYKYKNTEYASILGISLQELKELVVALKTKINKKFSNTRSFKYFQEQMKISYGTGIYDIDIKNEKVIDYYALKE